LGRYLGSNFSKYVLEVTLLYFALELKERSITDVEDFLVAGDF
jgi:hypothetical protein